MVSSWNPKYTCFHSYTKMQAQATRPKSLREARLWNFFQKQDDFWRIEEWPEYIKIIALKYQRNNRERYTFWFFLVGNGLDPNIASEWVLSIDFRQGNLVRGIYDESALRQVLVQLPKQNEEGSLWKGKKPMMDMMKGYVVTM